MKVKNWNPEKWDGEFIGASMGRVKKAAELVAERARVKCKVGTISRPMYRRGPYADQPWTARDAGQLKRSIRVVEKHDQKLGPEKRRNIRVYAGTLLNLNLAYYASIVEYTTPYLRPALNSSKAEIRSILENG